MDEFGLRDQYIPDMSLLGLPESLMKLHQSGIPATGTCANKNLDLRLQPDEKDQRLFPMRRKPLDRRIDEYEKTSVCENGSPRSHLRESFGGIASVSSDKLISISSENIFWFFFFIIFVFIIMHFNASINEIKKSLNRLETLRP